MEKEIGSAQRKKVSNPDLLGKVEAVGNRLPPPSIIYLSMCIHYFAVRHRRALGGAPQEWCFDTKNKGIGGNNIECKSLISIDGLKYMLQPMQQATTNFPSVGSTCTIMLAIGVAEQSG